MTRRYKIKTKNGKVNIAINGKFLEQNSGRSGVYRVAYELVLAIDDLLLKDPLIADKVSCLLIIPAKHDHGLKLRKIRCVHSNSFGQKLNRKLWEQLVLPRMARGNTLLNLCNLGPIFYGDAYTMIHDAQVNASPESYSLPFRIWYRLLQPRLAKINKAILTVSQFSRGELDKYKVVPASRVHVIHNGCDHVLRIRPDTNFIDQNNLTHKSFVVALSNTQKHKNIGVLFEAFSLEILSNLTLALFGSASRQDFEKLGYVVPPNVRFLGRISDEQLNGLLSGALALAFPSLTEGFGLPPLEAMLLGCPVVAAPCGALVEVCGDAVLWAEPYAADQWANQISNLYTNPDKSTTMVNAGYARAATFTWEIAARRLLNVLIQEPNAHAG